MVPGTNSSDINILFDYDFTERQVTYEYYHVADIVSQIGGIFAFIRPILDLITPLFILYFLYSLAIILNSQAKQAYHDELVELYD